MSYSIQNIPIKEIKPANYNPRDINPEALKGLIESIKKFGMPQPLIINKKTNILVSGHQRLRAAKALALETVPVVYVNLSDAEEKALNVTLNNQKISGHFTHELGVLLDEIRIELGDDFFRDIKLDEIEVPPLLEEEQEAANEKADSIPDVAQNELGVQLGDIYQLGDHRLMCGDSTDQGCVEKLMGGNKADMVFTDPPYGMNAVSKSGVLSKKYNKDILGDDNTDAAKKAFMLFISVFSSSQHIWWGANYYSSCLPDSECWIVWDKNNGGSDQTDCELAWTNLRSVVRKFTQASEKTNRVHPTQKPVSLIEWCFQKFKIANNIVDPFLGSGATLIACEKTKRKCYGMELDPHYCSVIIKRWEEFSGKQAVKL